MSKVSTCDGSQRGLRQEVEQLMKVLCLSLEDIQCATGLFSYMLADWLENVYDLPEDLKESLISYLSQQMCLVKPLQKFHVAMAVIGHDSYIKRSLDNYLRYFKGQENDRIPDQEDTSQLNISGQECQQVFRNIVPIRIDIEFDSRRYKENLLWNLDDDSLSGEQFSKLIVIENSLNQYFEHEIGNTVKRQLLNYKPYVNDMGENIQILDIDVRLDNVNIRDRIEWDVGDCTNDPHQYAMQMCQELGLSDEFKVQIAFEIWEQIYNIHRGIHNWQQQQLLQQQHSSHDDGTDIPTNIKRSLKYLKENNNYYNNIRESNTVNTGNYLRTVQQVYRDESDNLQAYEPVIEYLDDQDIRKVQRLEDRRYRYERRNR